VPACDGVNLLAKLGHGPRWVIVAAHYDHLGKAGRDIFRGADDNAAAVAILIEVARSLAARPPKGRSVLIAAFDAEEPPHFLTEAMGSSHFCAQPPFPLESVDLMVCMDLVGHAVGPEGAPEDVRQSVFALGAERSEGTGALVDRLARSEPGVVIRRMDAETVPPLSDYWGFWRREVPFLFLTNGRWQHYHTPEDTPEKLDYDKMAATANWIEQLARAPVKQKRKFTDGRDDAATLRTLRAVVKKIESSWPPAKMILSRLDQIEEGNFTPDHFTEARMALAMIESALA